MVQRSPPEEFSLSDADRRQSVVDQTAVPDRRAFDSDFHAYVLPVGAGGCVISSADDEMLVVVVGGSIAACIRDPVTGIGGMNHFLLPGHDLPPHIPDDYTLRFGHFAMEKLVNGLVARGANRARLEIKLFGGASLLKTKNSVAEENIVFVRQYLDAEGFAIASEDLGGLFPRRVQYFPKTGKIFRLLMRRSDDACIFAREVDFREQLRHNRVEGAITLFDQDRK